MSGMSYTPDKETLNFLMTFCPVLADSRLSRKKLLFTAMIQCRLAVDDPLRTDAVETDERRISSIVDVPKA